VVFGEKSLCVVFGEKSLCVVFGEKSLCVVFGEKSLCVVFGETPRIEVFGEKSLCVVFGGVSTGLHAGLLARNSARCCAYTVFATPISMRCLMLDT
jgi:hypothetical protein